MRPRRARWASCAPGSRDAWANRSCSTRADEAFADHEEEGDQHDVRIGEPRDRFFDTYRGYVINYNYGKDLVRGFIESRGGTADNPAKRWQEFEKLLSSPRLPSGLR